MTREHLTTAARWARACAILIMTLGMMSADATGTVPSPAASVSSSLSDRAAMDTFLDRLMMAESGGRDTATNPRSSAVGPFQFIVETFLDVTRRHFPNEIANLSQPEILALRTNRAFARRVAEAFTRDNAAHLVAHGQAATWAHLRLAFLVGPAGAVRLLRATPDTPLANLLSALAMQANPFMARLTVGDLIARAAREADPEAAAPEGPIVANLPGAAQTKTARSRQIIVTCDLSLPSCRKWLALAERRLRTGKGTRVATR